MRTQSNITTSDGITWYYEQEGSGPDIVLIPDGLGECQMFDKAVSLIAAEGFRVTTFDTPGMSRSYEAPPETYTQVTAQKLARHIMTLMDALQIDVASFWGCSSGACAVLSLAVDFAERVRSGMPHEAPMKLISSLSAMAEASDEGAIVAGLAEQLRDGFSGDPAAWDALGEDVHARLRKNYVRWARGYPLTIPPSTPVSEEDLEALRKRPIAWTVGAATPTAAFMDNIVTGTKIGAAVSTLPGKHFPYVSHPEAFAQHVVKTAKQYA